MFQKIVRSFDEKLSFNTSVIHFNSLTNGMYIDLSKGFHAYNYYRLLDTGSVNSELVQYEGENNCRTYWNIKRGLVIKTIQLVTKLSRKIISVPCTLRPFVYLLKNLKIKIRTLQSTYIYIYTYNNV